MEELMNKIQALQKEKTDLFMKLQTCQEVLKMISKEKDSLNILAKDLQAEKDTLSNIMHGLYKTIEKTVAANLELQDHVRATAESSKGCCEILQKAKESLSAMGPQPAKDQEQKMMASPKAELGKEVRFKTAEQAHEITEEEQEKGLVIENQRLKSNLQEVMLDNSYHRRRVMDFWHTIFSLRMENDHLRRLLINFTEKMVLSKLPTMEKKRNNIAILALNLKGKLEIVKSVVTGRLTGYPPAQRANILKQQVFLEQATEEVYSVLMDIEYYFSEWYRECKDYYVSISKFTTDLLDENLKQLKLLIEIQSLKKCEHYGTEYKQLDIPALRQKLDTFLENISQDLCSLEDQLLEIESKAQQLQKGKDVEKRSASFSIKNFEQELRDDISKLHHVLKELKPKLKYLANARRDVVVKHATYYKEAEMAMKCCQERSKQWQMDLKAFEVEMGSAGPQKLEEAKKLGENLNLVEKQMTDDLDKAAKIEKEELTGLMSQLAKTNLSKQET